MKIQVRIPAGLLTAAPCTPLPLLTLWKVSDLAAVPSVVTLIHSWRSEAPPSGRKQSGG